MVRIKAKARKGDEAFKTRKQKVGRKKLAPATATRAEVHARTLRVTTSSAITRGALKGAPVLAADGQGRKEEEKKKTLSAEQIHSNFKECLSGTRHYKKSMRSAAFVGLAKAIATSCEAMGRATHNPTASSPLAEGDGMFLSPLELLYAFTAALDAMTDTDDDVRQAAFATLKATLQPQTGVPRRWTGGMELGKPTTGMGSGLACDIDRARAVLRVVDVTLTHAMMSVRRTGIELLHLLLQVHPSGVRAVLDESEEWVKMASRVSSIVIPGSSSGGGSGTVSGGGGNSSCMVKKVVFVLPDLLETMLLCRTDGCKSNNAYSSLQDGKEKEGERKDSYSGALPFQILHLFDECAPKWSVVWKELMELQGSLFRDTERVQCGTAIARTFGCVSTYLREHHLLKRTHLQLIRHLFSVKVPFTVQELLGAKRSSVTGGVEGGVKARIEMANAIADACVPVASTTDDAWQILRDFLSLSIHGKADPSSQPASGLMGSSSVKRGGSGVQLLGPLRTLHMAVKRFPESLLPRLLFLVPQLMQATTRAINSLEGAAWEAVLFATADVLSTLLTSPVAASSSNGNRFLSEALLALPRLLFSIRKHDDAGLVDRVVFAFLRPLWGVVSSGHPLLQCSLSSAGGATTASQLCLSLTSLFELRVADGDTPGAEVTVEGVLHRCSDRTVELAVDVLFYLGSKVPCASLGNRSVSLAFPALAVDFPLSSSSC